MQKPSPVPTNRRLALLAAVIAIVAVAVPSVLRHSGKLGASGSLRDAALGAGIGVMLGAVVVLLVKARRVS